MLLRLSPLLLPFETEKSKLNSPGGHLSVPSASCVVAEYLHLAGSDIVSSGCRSISREEWNPIKINKKWAVSTFIFSGVHWQPACLVVDNESVECGDYEIYGLFIKRIRSATFLLLLSILLVELGPHYHRFFGVIPIHDTITRFVSLRNKA